MGQGMRAAPHQEIIAMIAALGSPAQTLKDLGQIARQAGSHLARLERKSRKVEMTGTNVFIGHGRAHAWRDLKDFVKDRLGLPYDEFNRVPVAGFTNIARLSEMLDAAAVAFIILTAEDEHTDGSIRARMNVIHEVGLFQGRLGFSKAIVLLEEGCEEFS
jgi:predicted nucleotide-binding protein